MARIPRDCRPFRVTNFSLGENRQVSSEDASPGEARSMVNFEIATDDPDLIKRGGTQIYEVPIPTRLPVWSQYRFYNNDGNKYLVAMSGDSIWAIQDGDAAWVEIKQGGLTASQKQWSFVNWVLTGDLYMVNGDQPGNFMFKWDGTMATDAVTTVATPERFKDIIMFQEKMFALTEDDQSRVYFSESAFPETYTNTKGLANFLATDSDQGDATVGMAVTNTGNLIVTKTASKFIVLGTSPQTYRMYRVNTDIGTVAKGTIQNVENMVYDLTRYGLYSQSSSDMNYISEREEPTFTSEANGNILDRAVSGYQGKRYFVAIPKTGSTYNDRIVVNDITSNCYYRFESDIYKIYSMSVWNNEGNNGEIYFGDDQGRIMKMHEGASDAQLKNETIAGGSIVIGDQVISVVNGNDLTVPDGSLFHPDNSYNVYDSGDMLRKSITVTAVNGNILTVDDAAGPPAAPNPIVVTDKFKLEQLTTSDADSFEVNRHYNVFDNGGTFRKVVQCIAVRLAGANGVVEFDDLSGVVDTDDIDGEIQLDIECEWISHQIHAGEAERRKRFIGMHTRMEGNGHTVRQGWNMNDGVRTGQVPDSTIEISGATYDNAFYDDPSATYSDSVPVQFSYKFSDGAKGQSMTLDITETSSLPDLRISYFVLWYRLMKIQFGEN